MEDVFINKVAESGILTIDLETYYPTNGIMSFDMKDYLFMGLILKEKDFRQALKIMDTGVFRDKIAAIHCSADAVIPMWAYMLAASMLQPVCKDVVFGSLQEVKAKMLLKSIGELPVKDFFEKRVVIKGCGEDPVPEEAYIEITKLLRPVAKSIMYGEPCSTVPVFKKERASLNEIPSKETRI